MRRFKPFALSIMLVSSAFAGSEKIRLFPPQGLTKRLVHMAPTQPVEEVARGFMGTMRSGGPAAPMLSAFASADQSAETKDMDLVKVQQNKNSVHVLFQQKVEGLPVFGQTVKVHHLKNDNSVLMMNGNYADPNKNSVQNIIVIKPTEAVAIAENHLKSQHLFKPSTVEEVFYPLNNTLLRAYKVLLFSEDPTGEFVYLIDAKEGTILKSFNQITDCPDHKIRNKTSGPRSASTRQSLVEDTSEPTENIEGPSGWVHSPSVKLSPKLWVVGLPDLDDSGTLSGKLVKTFPAKGERAISQDKKFFYKRGDPRYQEVMAYYHINAFNRYLKSLGFEVKQAQTEVVVMYGKEDNSFFSPTTKGLYFGSGGVPDAEDADIIIHEYGHAIVDELAHLAGGEGSETAAIHEGLADYFSASFFDNPNIGEWDASALNEDYARTLENTLRYPNDMTGGSHADGRIISGALWELRKEIGTKTADTMLLTALPFLPVEAEFQDLVAAFLAADVSRFEGRYKGSILKTFAKRGLKPANQSRQEENFNAQQAN